MTPHDESHPNDSVISRRTFGQLLGAAALTGALPQPAPHPPPTETAAEPRNVGADDALCFLSATELVARIRRKDISAREVMRAHLAQIERVNPQVNAIVTLVAERAMADAARADEAMARERPVGPLHGLPVAHKDLVDTAGIRTTRGSPFYRDHVPTTDALIVARIRAAGAVTLGKTNTPEFGAGSQTFNTVFGATRNPYDLAQDLRRKQRRRRGRTRVRAWCRSPTAATPAARCATPPRSATSSASGRRPAACRRRPRPGRRFPCPGPMARSVADVALFLSAIAGPDPRSPLSIAEDGARFAAPLGAISRACGSHGGTGSAAFRSNRTFAASSMPIAKSFEASRLHRRGGRAGLCGRRRGLSDVAAYVATTRSTRALVARAARMDQGHDQVRGRRGRAADRRRCGARAGKAELGCTSKARQFFSDTTISCCPSRRSCHST